MGRTVGQVGQVGQVGGSIDHLGDLEEGEWEEEGMGVGLDCL